MSTPKAASANRLSRFSIYCAFAVYLAVIALTANKHEPWADEAQAWLLARDASLFDLWTRLLHYEGTPGLWHTILYFVTHLGAPYAGLNIVSGILGSVAAWLVLKCSPLPIGFRLLLPFTFFLCYQYSVIARSYSLFPLLVFACAVTYKEALTRIAPFTVLLCLLAAVSVHGYALSISIWLAFYVSVALRWRTAAQPKRSRFLIAGAVYTVVLVLVALSAWPAKDVAFPFHIELTLKRVLDVGSFMLREGLTGAWVPSLAVIALSVRSLWKGGALLTFALSSGLLWAVSAAVYLQYWHSGILFLAWLFSIWIAAQRVRLDACASIALSAVIAIQIYWTVRSVHYDWLSPYSGSRSAAQSLSALGINNIKLYGMGYSCTAIQPYFKRNIFLNLNSGTDAAYWDWSSRNHAMDPTSFSAPQNPEYIVVGFKSAAEAITWSNVMKSKGYQAANRFEGQLFWRTHHLEPEAFDLYRRAPGVPEPSAASVVNLSDPACSWQLVRGFYGLEANAWRWTAREFSVVLKAPSGNAVFDLRFAIPETQIKSLGPMTLVADIEGHPLEPATYNQAGSYTYSRRIPDATHKMNLIIIHFQFDKASPPSAADARELGAIVSAVGVYSGQP